MDALGADVRRVDEDRWLASRFAPAPVREALVAIYAFNHEIARTAEVVSEPAIGDIRLAWWREAIAEIYEGGAVRAHPVLTQLTKAIRAHALPRTVFDALIEAHRADLEADPFSNWSTLEAYVDATAGGVMRLALAVAGEAATLETFAANAARAWGHVGLARAREHLAIHGRSVLPHGAILDEALARASNAYDAARAAAPSLPTQAFPAIGYIALIPAYLMALKAGRTQLSLISRQFRMIRAAATGRV